MKKNTIKTKAKDDSIEIDESTNITDQEKELLDKAGNPPTDEDLDLDKMALDDTDGEDPLNEEGDPLDMGSDLDIPGEELDDEDEELGEEDEENNSYSRPD